MHSGYTRRSYKLRLGPLIIGLMFGGRIGAFLIGAVTGVGLSEYFGPFLRSAKKEVGRAAQRGSESVMEEAKEKYQEVKSAAKEKY